MRLLKKIGRNKMVAISRETLITKHCKRRASERYQLNVNRKARIELLNIIKAKKIRKSNGKITGSDSDSRRIIEIPVFLSKELCRINDNVQFGDWAKVVYDIKKDRIVTFLPINKNNN